MSRAAVIIGASGGIGSALETALIEEGAFDRVWGFARSRSGADHIDLTDETTIDAAAQRVAQGPPVDLVVIATGLLHEDGNGPERALKELDAAWLARAFAINTIGPALIAKHFIPVLAKTGKPVFAALSARVGSISDNRLGGWYGYRAAKAALNQIIRTASIEAARHSPRSIVIALHPGTVDTALSKPFQGNVAPGKLFDPERAALQLLDVIEELGPADTGKLFAWDGQEIAP